MKRLFGIVFLLMVVAAPGCSNRALYDSLRYNQELRCQELQGSDRNECMQRSGMSYDEYQRRLKEREKDDRI